MEFDFKKIINAWITAANPTKSQSELAEKRFEICNTCPSKTEIIKGKKWSYVCGECGCPLNKKIFTNQFDACPLSKWKEVEQPYFNYSEKNKKTIL